jgi:hypothetical protein
MLTFIPSHSQLIYELDPSQSPEAKDKYLAQSLTRLFTLCGISTPFIVEGYSMGHVYVDKYAHIYCTIPHIYKGATTKQKTDNK